MSKAVHGWRRSLSLALAALAVAGQVQAQGVCGRTAEVGEAIVTAASGAANCGAVNAGHLAAITNLPVPGASTLQSGDFAGLTTLLTLSITGGGLVTLPDGVFDGLADLQTLDLSGNNLHDIYDAAIFDDLDALTTLNLAGSGNIQLRPGSLDPVFDTLTTLAWAPAAASFQPAGVQNVTIGGGILVGVRLDRTLPVAVRIPINVSGDGMVSIAPAQVVIPSGARAVNAVLSAMSGASSGNRTLSLGAPELVQSTRTIIESRVFAGVSGVEKTVAVIDLDPGLPVVSILLRCVLGGSTGCGGGIGIGDPVDSALPYSITFGFPRLEIRYFAANHGNSNMTAHYVGINDRTGELIRGAGTYTDPIKMQVQNQFLDGVDGLTDDNMNLDGSFINVGNVETSDFTILFTKFTFSGAGDATDILPGNGRVAKSDRVDSPVGVNGILSHAAARLSDAPFDPATRFGGIRFTATVLANALTGYVDMRVHANAQDGIDESAAAAANAFDVLLGDIGDNTAVMVTFNIDAGSADLTDYDLSAAILAEGVNEATMLASARALTVGGAGSTDRTLTFATTTNKFINAVLIIDPVAADGYEGDETITIDITQVMSTGGGPVVTNARNGRSISVMLIDDDPAPRTVLWSDDTELTILETDPAAPGASLTVDLTGQPSLVNGETVDGIRLFFDAGIDHEAVPGSSTRSFNNIIPAVAPPTRLVQALSTDAENDIARADRRGEVSGGSSSFFYVDAAATDTTSVTIGFTADADARDGDSLSIALADVVYLDGNCAISEGQFECKDSPARLNSVRTLPSAAIGLSISGGSNTIVSLQANPSSITEVATGGNSTVVTLRLANQPESPIAIPYTIIPDPGMDIMTASTGTFSFSTTDTAAVTITAADDDRIEPPEDFTLTLDPGDHGGIFITEGALNSTAAITILDDDGAIVSLQADPSSITEGAAGGDSAVVTLTLAGQAQSLIAIPYTIIPDPGTDITTATRTGSFEFSANNSTAAVTITALDDDESEPPEDFTFTLTSGTHDGISVSEDAPNSTAVITILDDDGDIVSLQANPSSITEVAAGGNFAVVTLELANPAQGPIAIPYTISPDPGMDITTASTGTFNFSTADTTATVTITAVDDDESEPSEHFALTLDPGTHDGILIFENDPNSTVTITILDDDDIRMGVRVRVRVFLEGPLR